MDLQCREASMSTVSKSVFTDGNEKGTNFGDLKIKDTLVFVRYNFEYTKSDLARHCHYMYAFLSDEVCWHITIYM